MLRQMRGVSSHTERVRQHLANASSRDGQDTEVGDDSSVEGDSDEPGVHGVVIRLVSISFRLRIGISILTLSRAIELK